MTDTHRDETRRFWNELPDLMSWFYHEEELKEKLSAWLDEYFELVEKYGTAKETKDTDLESLTDNGISNTITTIGDRASTFATSINHLFTLRGDYTSRTLDESFE